MALDRLPIEDFCDYESGVGGALACTCGQIRRVFPNGSVEDCPVCHMQGFEVPAWMAREIWEAMEPSWMDEYAVKLQKEQRRNNLYALHRNARHRSEVLEEIQKLQKE